MDIRQFFKDLARGGRIITGDDRRLRTPCAQILIFDSGILKLEGKLRKEIHRFNSEAEEGSPLAVGLAAPQIGKMVHLFVIDTRSFSLTMANARITATTGTWHPIEGCLSLPGRRFRASRHKVITVKGQDLTGKNITRRLHGEDAQIVSHELDHLNGILLEDWAIEELPAP